MTDIIKKIYITNVENYEFGILGTMVKKFKIPDKSDVKQSIHVKIVEALGKKIVSGDYAAGNSLGSEVTTGEAFNASRTAMREVLKILSSKGLIEARPKLGTIITPRDEWNLLDPQVLHWCLQDPVQSRGAMDEIYEIRVAFEPFAASLAAQNCSDDDLKAIRRALRGMAYYDGIADKAESDLIFHKAVLKATGNSLFLAVGDLISVALRHLFRAGLEATSEEDERWLGRHRDVFDAIESRDPQKSYDMMVRLLALAKETHTTKQLKV